jgi:hypothetical protein
MAGRKMSGTSCSDDGLDGCVPTQFHAPPNIHHITVRNGEQKQNATESREYRFDSGDSGDIVSKPPPVRAGPDSLNLNHPRCKTTAGAAPAALSATAMAALHPLRIRRRQTPPANSAGELRQQTTPKLRRQTPPANDASK